MTESGGGTVTDERCGTCGSDDPATRLLADIGQVSLGMCDDAGFHDAPERCATEGDDAPEANEPIWTPEEKQRLDEVFGPDPEASAAPDEGRCVTEGVGDTTERLRDILFTEAPGLVDRNDDRKLSFYAARVLSDFVAEAVETAVRKEFDRGKRVVTKMVRDKTARIKALEAECQRIEGDGDTTERLAELMLERSMQSADAGEFFHWPDIARYLAAHGVGFVEEAWIDARQRAVDDAVRGFADAWELRGRQLNLNIWEYARQWLEVRAQHQGDDHE